MKDNLTINYTYLVIDRLVGYCSEQINFLIKDVHDYALFMSLLGSFFVNTNSYSKSLLLKFSKAREKYLLHFTFWFSKLFFHLPCKCFLKFKNIQKTKHNIFHSLKGFLLPTKTFLPSCKKDISHVRNGHDTLS